MKYQILFSIKSKKKISSILSSAESAYSMVSIKSSRGLRSVVSSNECETDNICTMESLLNVLSGTYK